MVDEFTIPLLGDTAVYTGGNNHTSCGLRGDRVSPVRKLTSRGSRSGESSCGTWLLMVPYEMA